MTIQLARNLVEKDLQDVNHLIHQEISEQHPLVAKITANLLHAGGKQLRPLIVLLTSKALNYHGDKHIKLAAVLEFFHTASLLHDDVVDESTLRRGKKTAHEIWGNQASVLVGDYLFILHHQLLLSLKNLSMLELMADIERRMGYGELVQLANKNQAYVSTADYFSIIEAKTSLLFAAAAKLPGILCQIDAQDCEQLFAFGQHLGNAFQLIDDVLDYCSDPDTIGKNIGDDLADGKSTLPIIHALAQTSEQNKTIIIHSLKHGKLDNLAKIIEIVQSANSIEYTREIAQQEAQLAKQALNFLPDSDYKQALLAIVDYSIQRDH